MPQIDTGIYGNVRQFAMPDPLDQAGKAMALQANSLAVQDAQRKFSLEDDISKALSSTGGDYGKAADLLATQGRGTAAIQLKDKANAQRKVDIEEKLKMAEAVGSDAIALDSAYREALTRNGGDQTKALAEVTPVYQQVRAKWAQMGQQLPEQFDPVANFAGIGQAKELTKYLEGIRQKFGTPVPATNPQGKPDLYQPSETGGQGRYLGVTPAAKPNEPTKLSQLQSERAAIAEANPNDPRLKEFDAAIAKETTHQPATTVSVSTEKTYGSKFAGGVADRDVGMLDAAGKAPDLAARANSILGVLNTGKVITGTGADYRLALGKALQLVGGNDGETIANTEQLASSMAENTLDAIKASGLGAGNGFSNADRDFLEKAKGGKITLEANSIRRLAMVAHNVAAATAKKWNQRVQDIPDAALSGTGITRTPVEVPAMVDAKPADPRVVTLPNGTVKSFPTPAAAVAFKKAAGL